MVPSEFIELARTILLDLITSNKFGGYAGLWVKDRMKVSFFFPLFMSLSFLIAVSISKVATKHDRGLRQP